MGAGGGGGGAACPGIESLVIRFELATLGPGWRMLAIGGGVGGQVGFVGGYSDHAIVQNKKCV